MKRNVRLLILTILVLFVMPLVFIQCVSADPLESFTENPIPYWEDDSQGVIITWDSDNQTVTFDGDIDREDWGGSVWAEDCSTASDWSDSTWFSVMEVDDSFSSDGDLISLHSLGDATPDTDRIEMTTDIDIILSYVVQVRARVNSTNDVNLIQVVFMDDTNYYFQNMLGFSTSFQEWEFLVSDMTKSGTVINVDTVILGIQSDTGANTSYIVDYIRIGPADEMDLILDIAVPLEKDTIQNIETMGNFSALNSTVRFQMYDNVTDSGLWCDVNSTQVTFPDNTYAEFNDLVRIDFSLNEEISIFTISVSAQNMTLINYYSDYAELANKDYLLMTDSVFNGTYHLWYLQGDVGYLEESEDMALNIFEELFLSTEIWGYFGPLALIVIGIILMKKEKALWIFFIIVDSLVIWQYLQLVEATPDFWWHVIILVLGVITCAFQPVANR